MRATKSSSRAWRYDAPARAGVLACAVLLAGCDVSEVDDTLSHEPRAAADDASRVAMVRMVSDRLEIATGGRETATVTARLTDSLGRAVTGAPVALTADGARLHAQSSSTDAHGEIQATLSAGHDLRNREIDVGVESERVGGRIVIDARGSTLAIDGPDRLQLGDDASFTATLHDGEGQPIARQPLRFTSQVGNVIQPEIAITDAAGRATVQATTNYGDDEIGVIALDGTVTARHRFDVAQASITFAEPGPIELPIGETHRVPVTWTSDGLPVRFQPLRFAITRGDIVGDTEVVTDTDGRAEVELRAERVGPATITVASANNGDPTVRVPIEFVAVAPKGIELATDVSTVQAGEQARITAHVTDVGGQPVKGVRVRFAAEGLDGGALEAETASTNAAGEMRATLTAGPRPSLNDGIVVRAQVENAPLADALPLTVVSKRFDVALGASRRLRARAEHTQYSVPFTLRVTDRQGQALADAAIEIEAYPLEFAKGAMQHVDRDGLTYDEAVDRATWRAAAWAVRRTVDCGSEDLDRDGILDGSEDRNANGRLDPGSQVLLFPTEPNGRIVGEPYDELRTDADGSAYFDMVYPTSHALWARVRVVARVRALGVESTRRFDTILPIRPDDLDDPNISPPNATSPHGVSDRCADTL